MADRRLQVFHTVAKQLSFTKAADLLFMTQPAVTFQVKQLEEHFNIRLFDRSHGKIALTPAGDLVLHYAERILALSAELEVRMGEITGEIRGPLLIGASTTIAEFMLPRILGEFSVLYPEVQARLTVANSDTIEHRVADHSLDVGLIESPSHLISLNTEAYGEDELVVICGPKHKLATAASLTPQQLTSLPYISRESGSGTHEFTDSYFSRVGISPEDLNMVMELGSPEAVKGMVETGIGYAIVSRTTIIKELSLGLLVAIPLKPKLIRIMSLVYPKDKFRSRLLASFIEFAIKHMKKIGA